MRIGMTRFNTTKIDVATNSMISHVDIRENNTGIDSNEVHHGPFCLFTGLLLGQDWSEINREIIHSLFFSPSSDFFFHPSLSLSILSYASSLIILLTMITTNSYISIDRLECNDVLDTLHIHHGKNEWEGKQRDREGEGEREREELIQSRSRFEESCLRCHKE